MSQTFANILSPEQQKLLNMFGKEDIGVLVGGTALALQLGHRKSYDLDFATEHEVTEIKVAQIQKLLSAYAIEQRLQTATQYTAVAGEVKITLFQDTAEFLHPSIVFGHAQLASIQDIFSTKLFILGKRATWRDYCDIAVCLDQKKVEFTQGVKEAMERYHVVERWILEPMTYFADLEVSPIEWIGKQYTVQEIQHILVDAVSGCTS